jgi:ribosomal protein S18 acetylase RimI-like enzyme
VPGRLEPFSVDPVSGRAFARRAIETRAQGGQEAPVWAEEFGRRLASGEVSGRLYVLDGRPVGLASWSAGGPVGALVQLLYSSVEGSEPARYGEILAALEGEVGPVAFVSGPFAGLSATDEEAVMLPRGFRRFGRSEMVLQPDGVPFESTPEPGESLRGADRPDLDRLVELHRAAYHDRFDRYLFLDRWDETEDARVAVTEILDGRWGAFEPRGSWILERSGRPAGAILSVRTPAGTLVADVAVAPELQGRGVGRRLLARAVRSLRESGERKVYLNVTEGNERALRLYARLGFVRSLGPTRDWYNARLIPVAPGPDG